MTRPSFRVFVTRHHGGLSSAVLLRRYRVMFDPPPPAAMAEDVETALARLAPQAALIADDDETRVERYLWTEELELRRDRGRHPSRPPRSARLRDRERDRADQARLRRREARRRAALPRDRAALRLVVRRRGARRGARHDPLARVRGAGRRLAGLALRSAPRGRRADRRVEPDRGAPRARETAARRRRSRADARGGRRGLGRARARRPAARRPSASIRSSISSRRLLDEKRLPSLLLVGPRGAGKTALVRRIARGLLDRSRGKGAASAGCGRRAPIASSPAWSTSACGSSAASRSSRSSPTAATCSTSIGSPTSWRRCRDGASIAELLAPAVIAGELSLIAECDEAELVRARQRYPALVDALRVVRVPEATPAQMIALLEPYGQRLDAAGRAHARRRAPARRAARRVPPRHRVPRQGARVRRLPRARWPASDRADALSLARAHDGVRRVVGAARRAARARARARHRRDRERSCARA